MPARTKCELTDDELLLLIEQGRSFSDIARLAGITRQAVQDRVSRIRAAILAPTARRAEEVVQHTFNAFAALENSLRTLNELAAAAERMLEGEFGYLDVGPHDYDLEVLVSIAGAPPTRVPLRTLLKEDGGNLLLSVEAKHADPRTLLISTLKEMRAHVESWTKLHERLYQSQRLELFITAVAAEIDAASPEVAALIKGRLRARAETRALLDPYSGSPVALPGRPRAD